MFPTFSAQAQWQGQTRRFTLEVRDGTLEFWDTEREHPEEWRFAVWHPIYKRDAAYWTREALESLWRTAIERGNIGRRVDVSDELTFFLRQKSLTGKTYRRDFLRFRGQQREVKEEVCCALGEEALEHPLTFLVELLENECLNSCDYHLGETLYEYGIPLVFNPDGLYPPRSKEVHMGVTRGSEKELIDTFLSVLKLEPQWMLTHRRDQLAGVRLVLHSHKSARIVPGAMSEDWG